MLVKEDIKIEACISMMPKTETSGDDDAEEWSTLVNWKEVLTRRARQKHSNLKQPFQSYSNQRDKSDLKGHDCIQFSKLY